VQWLGQLSLPPSLLGEEEHIDTLPTHCHQNVQNSSTTLCFEFLAPPCVFVLITHLSQLLSCRKHSHTHTQLFYNHYTEQPLLANTAVKNWRTLLQQSCTARMSLLQQTRHRVSTSMYSLTFYVRVMSPERHQWKPAVQATAAMLRTPPVDGQLLASQPRPLPIYGAQF